MFWYMNMIYDVKWAKAKSNSFAVLCGTKQGGILSPDFFAIYINDLITSNGGYRREEKSRKYWSLFT